MKVQRIPCGSEAESVVRTFPYLEGSYFASREAPLLKNAEETELQMLKREANLAPTESMSPTDIHTGGTDRTPFALWVMNMKKALQKS